MNTYIALFRGINVGGHNTLPMKKLKALLDELGCKEIHTVIQSGNVVFQHAAAGPQQLSEDISSKIEDSCGFKPKTLLLTKSDWEKIVKKNPFETTDGKSFNLYILESPALNPNLEKIDALKSATEQYKLTDQVFYLFAPDGIGRSKLAAKVEQCLGVSATARNWNTVTKLNALI